MSIENTARSVVGDASEGEAWPDAHLAELEGYCAKANIDTNGAPNRAMCEVLDAVPSLIRSLRSTRAALEEARKDAERLDWLENEAMDRQHMEVNYTDAWSEFYEGSILSSGPAEFYLRDDGCQCGPTLRDAIDRARRAIPSQESTKV